jgi:hypothetical protein
VLLLLVATVISLFLRDTTDAAMILGIVVVSGLLGFWHPANVRDDPKSGVFLFADFGVDIRCVLPICYLKRDSASSDQHK